MNVYRDGDKQIVTSASAQEKNKRPEKQGTFRSRLLEEVTAVVEDGKREEKPTPMSFTKTILAREIQLGLTALEHQRRGSATDIPQPKFNLRRTDTRLDRLEARLAEKKASLRNLPSSKESKQLDKEREIAKYLRYLVPLAIFVLKTDSRSSTNSGDSSDESYDSGYSWAQYGGVMTGGECENAFSGLLWGGSDSQSFRDGCHSYLNNEGLLDIFD